MKVENIKFSWINTDFIERNPTIYRGDGVNHIPATTIINLNKK